MQIPIQIAFDGLEPSEFIESALRDQAARLERFYPRLTSCRVVVSSAHHHHHKGRLYSIRIDLTLPGGELIVNREHALEHAHEDVYVAMRDSFDAARRQLEDYARTQRADVKTHQGPARGQIVRLLPEEGYGFIRTADGLEVYFHRNSVLGDAFSRLDVGTPVHFVLEQADKGPNAKSVRIAGRQKPAGGQSISI